MPRIEAPRPATSLPRAVALLLPLLTASALAAQQTVVAPAPMILQSDRYEILLVTPKTIGTLRDDARLGSLISSCRRAMRIAPQDSAAAVARRGWDWSAGPTADPHNLTLVVIPSEPLFVSCADRETQDRVAAARALRVTNDSVYAASRDIDRVTLWRDKERIVPALSERAEIARLGSRGVMVPGAGTVRLSLPIEALAPGPTGARSDLVLEVWNERDTLPDLIPLPWSAIAAAWEEMLGPLAERALARGTRSTEAPLVTPVPQDTVLRRARERYLAGDFAAANRAVIPRMVPAALGTQDHRNSRVQLALTLASVGDTATARVLLGLVVAESPCFTLASGAPGYARHLMEGLHRPGARCRSNSLAGTALRASLLPGFGYPASFQRKAIGAVAVGVIGASLASGFSASSDARSLYEQYLAVDFTVTSRPADSSRTLHQKAESQRSSAKQSLAVAVVVWGATVVESVLHEALLARSLRQVQEYGAPGQETPRRGASLAPRNAPGQLGFSLFFF